MRNFRHFILVLLLFVLSATLFAQPERTLRADFIAPNAPGGTVDITTTFSIGATTAVDSILDEDDLVSDSATALVTQQSVKAYVDTEMLLIDNLGDVTIATPAISDVLIYDGAAWVNSSSGGGGGINQWMTAESYLIGMVIWEGNENALYRALTNHTSTVFATDLANGDWQIIGASTADNVTTVSPFTVQGYFDLSLNKAIFNNIVVTDDGGLNFSWGAGSVYDAANLIPVATLAGSSSCTDNDTTYLYWDSTSTLSVGLAKPTGDQILVGTISCQSGDIITNLEEPEMAERTSDIIHSLSELISVAVIEGMELGEDTDVTNVWDVSITPGEYYIHAHKEIKTVGTLSRLAPMTRHYKVAGVWTSDTNIEIDTTKWNDGTDLVPVSGTAYYKSCFYMAGDAIHWVYPTEASTQSEAIITSCPDSVPGLDNSSPVKSLVLLGSATVFPQADSTLWGDIRPSVIKDFALQLPQFDLKSIYVSYDNDESFEAAHGTTTAQYNSFGSMPNTVPPLLPDYPNGFTLYGGSEPSMGTEFEVEINVQFKDLAATGQIVIFGNNNAHRDFLLAYVPSTKVMYVAAPTTALYAATINVGTDVNADSFNNIKVNRNGDDYILTVNGNAYPFTYVDPDPGLDEHTLDNIGEKINGGTFALDGYVGEYIITSTSYPASDTSGSFSVNADVDEGSVYYNTVDKVLRDYRDGQWRVRESITEWITLGTYVQGVYVSINDNLYKCLTNHTAGVFATDLAASKWKIIGGSSGGGINEWVTATVYAIADVIWEAGTDSIYRALTNHTSGVFATDLANNDWRLIGEPNPDAAEIKTLYESNADTNAYDDASKAKVDFITITGAVDLDLFLPELDRFYDGTTVNAVDGTITSDGAIVTATVEETGGGDVIYSTSTGIKTLDCTPICTVALTPGTDANPIKNWMYIDVPGNTFNANATGFPLTEHVPLATSMIGSAGLVQTDGTYATHRWNDHLNTDGDNGHLSHINAWIRFQDATWVSGMATSYSGSGTSTVNVALASGEMFQLHRHTTPAIVTPAPMYIYNHEITSYLKTTNLATIVTDSTGATLNNRYYSLVMWHAYSELTGDSKVYINKPAGSYISEAQARADADKFTDYSIPEDYRGTATLMYRFLGRITGGTNMTIYDGLGDDLRGTAPNTASGSSTSVSSEFLDSEFNIVNLTDSTKKLLFDLAGLTTATSRTLTVPDKSGTIATLDDVVDKKPDVYLNLNAESIRATSFNVSNLTLATFGEISTGQINGLRSYALTNSVGAAGEYVSYTKTLLPRSLEANGGGSHNINVQMTENNSSFDNYSVQVWDKTNNAKLIEFKNASVQKRFYGNVNILPSTLEIEVRYVILVGKASVLYIDDNILSDNALTNSSLEKVETSFIYDVVAYGSTDNKIFYYAQGDINVENDLYKITTDSTNGTIIEFKASCTATISGDIITSSASDFGLSKNSTQLTTSITAITESTVFSRTTNSNGASESFSGNDSFVAGDKIRVHSDGAGVAGSTNNGRLNIRASATQPYVLIEDVREQSHVVASVESAGNAGEVITGGTQDVPFIELSDTAGAFSGTAYTVQKDNTTIQINVSTVRSASNNNTLELYKNGTQYRTLATVIGYSVIDASYTSSVGEFVAGDVISIRMSTTATLINNVLSHFLNIVETYHPPLWESSVPTVFAIPKVIRQAAEYWTGEYYDDGSTKRKIYAQIIIGNIANTTVLYTGTSTTMLLKQYGTHEFGPTELKPVPYADGTDNFFAKIDPTTGIITWDATFGVNIHLTIEYVK